MTKAIGLKETGLTEMCHYARGGSGELFCYQLMPSTWKAYSIQVLGYYEERPTKTTVEYVVANKIQKFMDKGWNEDKIALVWNGGENATRCSSGTNKYGQKYSSCDYVNKLKEILKNI